MQVMVASCSNMAQVHMNTWGKMNKSSSIDTVKQRLLLHLIDNRDRTIEFMWVVLEYSILIAGNVMLYLPVFSFERQKQLRFPHMAYDAVYVEFPNLVREILPYLPSCSSSPSSF